jgi:integrase
MRVKVRKWRGRWCTDYRARGSDHKIHRHIEVRKNKRDAEAAARIIEGRVAAGTHVPLSQSPTVAEAAAAWIEHVKAEGRERTTVDQYEQHVRLHIVPVLGAYKLAELRRPSIERFKDELLKSTSRAMAKKVLVSLKAIFNEAMRTGSAAHNPAAGVKVEMRKLKKLEVGVDIPTVSEVFRMIDKAPTSFARTLIEVAAFTGMRSGELRALHWSDIDFKARKINVRQAVTRYGIVKMPKSDAGHRVIPCMRRVIMTLEDWKREHGKHKLVFSTATGNFFDQGNLLRRVLHPAEAAAGILVGDEPKYDLKSLRHFYASLCCNRRSAGGFELPLKEMAERMGHTDPAFTLRRYGHLFPTADETADLAEAEHRLLMLAVA